MRITVAFGTIAAATSVLVGAAAPAFASTPPAPRTVAGVQARVDAKAQHITAKMQTLQSRLAGKPKLSDARVNLQADITKVLAATDAWRKQVHAASTMAGIRAAEPAHTSLKSDLAKLHTDLVSAKATLMGGAAKPMKTTKANSTVKSGTATKSVTPITTGTTMGAVTTGVQPAGL